MPGLVDLQIAQRQARGPDFREGRCGRRFQDGIGVPVAASRRRRSYYAQPECACPCPSAIGEPAIGGFHGFRSQIHKSLPVAASQRETFAPE